MSHTTLPAPREMPHFAARRAHLLRETAIVSDRRRTARVLVPAVAAVLAAVIGAASAFGVVSKVERLFSNGPGVIVPAGVPNLGGVDASHATKLVSLSLSDGRVVTMWQAPSASGGGLCTFESYSDSSATAQTPANASGAKCNTGTPPAQWPSPGHPIETWVQGTLNPTTSTYNVLIGGHVDPASGIAALYLQTPSGTTQLPFENGYYLGELPNQPSANSLPTGGPFTLVAVDSSGKTVTSKNLEEVFRRADPGASH